MGPQLTYEFLKKLPKTDLHVHLDGSLRLDTLIELARDQGVELPTWDREGVFELVYAGEVCNSLDDYLKAFETTTSVLQTEEALERAAFELAEDNWREGVRYVEVRYAPILHTQRGLRHADVVEAVLRGLRRGEREYGIRYGLLVCGIRTMSAESSLRVAELAVAFKNRGVVGFDLAGSEVGNPAKDHREAFQRILDNNINCTAHAGEAFGPESIHQALHKCGAHRIGHGTRLREDGDLLNYVNDHRIPLEVCPSSNLQTKVVESLETHPVDFYVDYGLRVTINTDNRLITHTTVTDELLLCHTRLGWDFDTLKRVITAGFKSAFLPHREKADLLASATRELEAFPEPGASSAAHEKRPASADEASAGAGRSSRDAPAPAGAGPGSPSR